MLNNEFNGMQRITPDVEEAKKLLSNSLINKLTYTNAYSYYATYLMLILFFCYHALHHVSWFGLLLSLLTGYMAWTFVEYLIHRFIFHWESSHPAIKLMRFIIHDVHHAYPRDVPRSITPLILSLPIAVILYVVFKLLLGTYVDGIFAGLLMGYVLYSVIHDSTHHFPMKYPVLNILKKHHMHHHYFDVSHNFAVSNPVWDVIFRTYVKPN